MSYLDDESTKLAVFPFFILGRFEEFKMADGDYTETDYDNNFALELDRIVCNGSNNRDLGPGSSFLESLLKFDALITQNSRWRSLFTIFIG